MQIRLSRLILLAAAGIVGLLLGASAGVIHLYLFKRSGGEAAGTEVALLPLYAIAGALLGAATALIGAWWMRKSD